MAATEYLVVLRVKSARGLPKTDLFSKIDPFVKVVFEGRKVHQTGVKLNNDAPVWDEVCSFTARADDAHAGPVGLLTLELLDKDTFSSCSVGTATTRLEVVAGCKGPVELQWQFHKRKFQRHDAHVLLEFEGCVFTYPTLRAALSATPGAFFNDAKRRLYVPVAATQGAVYLGVEYEANCIDLKVYTVTKDAALFLDLLYSGVQKSKIRRRVFPDGENLVCGLTVYEELKMDDIPLYADFTQLLVTVYYKHQDFAMNAGDVAHLHGWRGVLGFRKACRKLTDVLVDPDKEEVYMSMPGADAREMFFVVDWDEDNVDIKLAVLAIPESASKGYDLTIRGQRVRKTSQVHVPPRLKCNGQLAVARMYELDDVAYGTALNSIWVYRYSLSHGVQVPVASVVQLRAG